MLNKRIRWFFVFVLIMIGGWLFYKFVYIPKSTYDYVVVKKGELTLEVYGIGNVSAKNFYPISSNNGGKIVQIYKDQGEFIKKGELIAVFDPVDLPKQLEELQVQLKKAKLESKALKKELDELKAQYRLAQKNFRRYELLYKQGFAAQIEYDKALRDVKVLDAQIAASKVKIASSVQEQKRVQKSIEGLKEKLSRLKVISPINGYIISKDAQTGETIAPQQPLITVVKPNEVWIKAYIDERISTNVKVGQKSLIVLRSNSDKKLKGYVARIEAKSDPITEERVVNIAFNKVPKPFYINEQAEVTIATGSIKNALLIPLRAIHNNGVWIYRQGKAHFKKIEIVGKNLDVAAIKGLKEDEKILIPNPNKKPLFEGASVRI